MPDPRNPFRPLPPEPPPQVVSHQPPVDRPSRAPAIFLGMLAGGAVGGLAGAVGRALVAVYVIYAVDTGGGSFFGGGKANDDFTVVEAVVGSSPLLLISAVIGLLVCGIAGATCRVWIGAPIGALLSALPCFVLVVFPSTFLMSMSGGNNTPDLHAVWLGLVGMVIVGALAGGLGGHYGKKVMRRRWPKY